MAAPGGDDDARHGSDLGMTSVARHSEPSPTALLKAGRVEANVCTPRPTSSRVTTADGRSPGLRVVTLRRLPRTEIPSGIGRRIHRLQLRGQPRNWGNFPAPHSLLIPKRGTVRNYGRSLSKSESIPSGRACRPHWTSASFLPHEHTCCTGAGKAVQKNRQGRSMSVQAVTAANEEAARRRIGVTAALTALVGLLVLISLGIGPVRLSPLAVIETLFGGGSDVAQVIVREIRLPRTILALSIGAILGLSGAALQGLLRNPLASPSLFGAPQSAAFGAVLVIALGLADVRSYALPVAAILAAF